MTKKHLDALDEIANYILPVYTVNGEKYVKVEVAEYLRDLAREALKKKAREEPIPHE